MKRLFAIFAALCILATAASCSKKDGNTDGTTALQTSEEVLTSAGTGTAEAVTGTPADTATEPETEPVIQVEDSSAVTKPTDTADTPGTEADVADTNNCVPDDTAEPDGTVNDVIEEPKQTYAFEEFAGWWHRPEGFVADDTSCVADVIFVDSEKECWTEYSVHGVASGTYSCFVDTCWINLEYQDLGFMVLEYNGNDELVNLWGTVEYIRGDAIDGIDESLFEGKWYKAGDTEGDFYEVTGDDYKLMSADGDTADKGKWSSDTVTKTPEGGSEISELQFTAGGAVYAVADGGVVLYDPEENTAYIHESVLGESEGDDLVRKYDLICHTWKGNGAGSPNLIFDYYGSTFSLMNLVDYGNGNVEVITEVCGTWDVREYELSLHYGDGHEEITPYDPETLVFSYYNMSFDKNA